MRIRFYGGRVLSGRPLQPQNAEVWVENDRISYVGPARPDAPAFDREIDLKGDLLMPGFKNAHTHSAMTFLRSYADDLPFTTGSTSRYSPWRPSSPGTTSTIWPSWPFWSTWRGHHRQL